MKASILAQSIAQVTETANKNKFKAVVYDNQQVLDLGFPRHLLTKTAGFALKLGFGNKEVLNATVRGGNVRISMPKRDYKDAKQLETDKQAFWSLVSSNLEALVA